MVRDDRTLRNRLLIPEYQDLHRTAVDRFVALAASKVVAGTLVVDAGAGEGMYRDLFDHSRYLALDYGIGDAGWDYSRLHLICDLHDIPIRSGTVPVVLCTQTLEHVTQPQVVLDELSRILETGGILYCTLPFLGDAHHQEPHDYYRYTRYAVENLLRKSGFASPVITPFGGYNTLVVSLLLKGVYRFFEKRKHWPRIVLAPLILFWRFLFVGVRWLNRIAWNLDQRDPHRYRFALGWGVVARKPGGVP